MLNIRKFRHSYDPLRSSSMELEIERGRYQTVREQRLCKVCSLGEVENVFDMQMSIVCRY